MAGAGGKWGDRRGTHGRRPRRTDRVSKSDGKGPAAAPATPSFPRVGRVSRSARPGCWAVPSTSPPCKVWGGRSAQAGPDPRPAKRDRRGSAMRTRGIHLGAAGERWRGRRNRPAPWEARGDRTPGGWRTPPPRSLPVSWGARHSSDDHRAVFLPRQDMPIRIGPRSDNPYPTKLQAGTASGKGRPETMSQSGFRHGGSFQFEGGVSRTILGLGASVRAFWTFWDWHGIRLRAGRRGCYPVRFAQRAASSPKSADPPIATPASRDDRR